MECLKILNLSKNNKIVTVQIPHQMDIRCFLYGVDGQEDAQSGLIQKLTGISPNEFNVLTKSGAARFREYIFRLITTSYMIHLDFLPIPVTISLRPARRTLNHFQVTLPTAERMLIYQTVPIYM